VHPVRGGPGIHGRSGGLRYAPPLKFDVGHNKETLRAHHRHTYPDICRGGHVLGGDTLEVLNGHLLNVSGSAASTAPRKPKPLASERNRLHQR